MSSIDIVPSINYSNPMFDYGTEFTYWWRSLLRILYPANCILCKIPLLLDELHLCLLCRQRIQPLPKPHCLKCARPIPPYDIYTTCSSCRTERPCFDRGFALVEFDETTKSIFHQIKFQKKPWLFEIFSGLLQNSFSSFEFKNYELMIPVPLDFMREQKRGFNQALIIAKMLKRLDPTRELLIPNLIKKTKKTAPQSRLRRNERLKNLSGAFKLKELNLVRGKNILLIDDIITTGSTINECARLLKENGAERVDFFTIARSNSI